MTWKDRAACRGLDVALFYGQEIDNARAVCEQCPVSDECLIDTLEYERVIGKRYRYGVRAGFTAQERSALIDELGIQTVKPSRAECGTTGGYQRHRYYGEETCSDCKRAHSAAQSARKKQRKAVA